MKEFYRLLRLLAITMFLLLSSLVSSYGQRAHDGGQPSNALIPDEPTDPETPTPTVTLPVSGPVNVCARVPVAYYSYYSGIDCSAGNWTWTTDDPGAIITSDNYGSVVISWATEGRHQVSARITPCINNQGFTRTLYGSLTGITVSSSPRPVITPGTGLVTENFIPTADGVSICEGSSLRLSTPPIVGHRWAWSGEDITSRWPAPMLLSPPVGHVAPDYIIVTPTRTTTYTLTYEADGTACPPVVYFTVTVVPQSSAIDAPAIERFGPGPVTLAVTNPVNSNTYTWYASETGPAIGTGPSLLLSNVPISTTYYLTGSLANPCQNYGRIRVPVVIMQLKLGLSDGSIPAAAVPLTPGTGTTLKALLPASNSFSGPFVWRRGGIILPQTSAQITVYDIGLYTVEIPFNGGVAVSQAIEIVDPLGAQTVGGESLNFSSAISVLKPGVTDPFQIDQLTPTERRQVVSYTDGFDRPIQTIAVKASPAQSDVVQATVYDEFGSAPRQYLPYVRSTGTMSGRYQPSFRTDQTAFYQTASKVAHDTQPFSTSETETSPLGRPLSVNQAGQSFTSKPSTAAYGSNTSLDAVRLWVGLNGTQLFPAGVLTKQMLTDPDGRRVEVYRDKLDRIVLKRKMPKTGSSDTRKLDTYTIYDDAGAVSYIIPPGAVASMANSGVWNNLSNEFIGQWLFTYLYDDQHRVIERKVPGAAAVHTVYDRFGRRILVQDGNRRASNQWYFTKYDERGRAVVEGLLNDARPRATLQAEALAASGTEFESRQSTGHYSTNTYPAVQEGTNGYLLSESFFDDYDLNVNGSPDYAYRTQGLTLPNPEPIATNRVLGQPTVSRKRIINPGNGYGAWLTTVLFYDQYGNLIQKQSNSQLNLDPQLPNTTTLVYREQGFVSQIIQTIKQQTTTIGGRIVVRNRFSYDAAGHLVSTWQQHERNAKLDQEVLVSRKSYNELGQEVEKNLHSRDAGATFMQSEDFRYALSGGLSSINNSGLTNDGITNDDTNDIFGFELIREQTDNTLGNTARYDGGISAVRWKTRNQAQQNHPELQRSYKFTYDGFGRLTDANYAARDVAGNWTLEVGAYDESQIRYDNNGSGNGNITGLKRFTQDNQTSAPRTIDDLVFSYRGNRPDWADDYSGSQNGFTDRIENIEYEYDANGSVTRDGNKQVNFRYNFLNKVDQQSTSTGNFTLTYDAAGTLLTRTVSEPSPKTLQYVDGFVYEITPTQTGLTSVPTSEGRAVVLPENPGQLVYEYHLRDHLGNMRVAFRSQGTEELKLTSEDPGNEEGNYPRFQRVWATRSNSRAYQGAYSAAVSATQTGPYNRIPVTDGERMTVQVYYATPAGMQYSDGGSSAIVAKSVPKPLLALAPVLLPTFGSPSVDGRSVNRSIVTPALQLSMVGLLSGLNSRASARTSISPLPPESVFPTPAYVQWTLYNSRNEQVSTGRQEVSDYTPAGWRSLSMSLDIDLSTDAARTGYIVIQLANDGSQLVYFDDLTIRHPKEQLVVSQENHYYPSGLALNGVAVNTLAGTKPTKELFNGGSDLQDELLGEASVYSTFYRNYDPTIGRFQGVDPLADSYADWTPYQFAIGDPINFNDPNGDRHEMPGGGRGMWYYEEAGSGGGSGGGSGSGGFGGFGGENRGYGGSPINDWGSGFYGGGDNGLGGGGAYVGGRLVMTSVLVSQWYTSTTASGNWEYYGQSFWLEQQYVSQRSSSDSRVGSPLNYVKKRFDDINGDIGNFFTASGWAAGTVSNRLGSRLAARASYSSVTIFRNRIFNTHIPTNLVRSSGAALKTAGTALGVLSLGITAYQYANNQISGTEALVDSFFGVVGFIGPVGAGVSLVYFGGKFAYETLSGETLFEKPIQKP